MVSLEVGIIEDMIAKYLLCAALAALCMNGCSHAGPGASTTASTSSSAAARDAGATNPPGDIPDTQAFVTYASPQGYAVLFPEGWSQTRQGATVTFRSQFDGEQISLQKPVDPASVVRGHFAGVRDLSVRHVTIQGRPVTVVTFTSQSIADPVTGRSLRLDNEAYFFTTGSRRAVLALWAPRGSDNADQWRKISESFHWK
ncbi:MAG TPA: hypothetical protein VGQ96_02775 [Candidatus Eremiobacteraceae bacterium]|nr:hypothetical protein [Candidatus Eremiobacteraceae bacterium]